MKNNNKEALFFVVNLIEKRTRMDVEQKKNLMIMSWSAECIRIAELKQKSSWCSTHTALKLQFPIIPISTFIPYNMLVLYELPFISHTYGLGGWRGGGGGKLAQI